MQNILKVVCSYCELHQEISFAAKIKHISQYADLGPYAQKVRPGLKLDLVEVKITLGKI